MAFDRRPWDPENELDTEYQRRADVFEAFDRFRKKSGISDRQAERILMLLYDFQQNMMHLDADLDDSGLYLDTWAFERRLHAASALRRMLKAEALAQLESMLSPDQMRAWWRTVERARVWLRLSFEPMLHPTPDRSFLHHRKSPPG